MFKTVLFSLSVCIFLGLILFRFSPSVEKCDKLVVVAMPHNPAVPFDPRWYTLEYYEYLKVLFPNDKYKTKEWFVSFNNIDLFLDDMQKLAKIDNEIVVLNLCDGGEWDGYPGITLMKKWEEHPVSKIVRMTGADTEFLWHSDHKARMQTHIHHAGLPTLPDLLLPHGRISSILENGKLDLLLVKEGLNEKWPLFIKLNIGAGALGVNALSVNHDLSSLKAKIVELHKNFPNSDLLIQPFLSGPEYTVLILHNTAIAAARREFNNPYQIVIGPQQLDLAGTEYGTKFGPAPDDVKELALKAVRAMPGIHHYSRVDVRADESGNLFVIDINDRPGFGPSNTLNIMLEYLQMDEADFIQRVVDSASILSRPQSD